MSGLPDGAVVDPSWLESHGYSASLQQHYVRQGWLARLSRGAYQRPGPRPSWESVFSSLQCLQGDPAVVGGRTALNLFGLAHYLPQDGQTELKLWADRPLRGWVASALPSGVTFVQRNPRRLFLEEGLPRCRRLPPRDGFRFGPEQEVIGEGVSHLPRGPEDWPLALSSPERATLELLHEIPKHETFEQADDLFDGLATLSPNRLSRLLALCRSVRTLRLFAWFAKRHNHPWNRRLDLQGIRLGSGKRQIAPGGELDPELNITVPKRMAARYPHE